MRASYRLQLRGGTDLDAARRLVPYLSQLGVSHLYLSPIFRARSGSTHGYDVTDPLRVDPVLGGEAALARLVAALRGHGLGLLLDIVPNHQAADPENPYFADVLRHGRGSRFAGWFDVAWGAAGRIVLPVLDAPPGALLARGELKLARRGDAEPFLGVHGRRFPLAPETLGEAAALARARAPARAGVLRLLERQHYRLLPWRTGQRALNYRRFFDVDELIAVRCEDAAVFDATHAALFAWVERGLVDAVRVDHVDGLADPAGYLARLRAGLDARRPPPGRVPVYVEKILAHDEELPRWPVAGTTGYEFAAALDAACVAPPGAQALRGFWRELTREAASFDELARVGKREALATLFPAELGRLAEALRDALAEAGVARAPAARRLWAALAEAIAALDVYRSYADAKGRLSRADRARWGEALRRSGRTRPALAPELRLLRRVLLGRRGGRRRAELLRRLQQLSGPAAAKGVEDTALYRHFAVPSLCEVGGDPEAPRGDALAALQRANAARLAAWPDALLAATTHDTKHSDGARARLAALTTSAAAWCDGVRRWRGRNAALRGRVAGLPAPEPAGELALYQALLALWPALASRELPDAAQARELRERLRAWSRKAAREAKRRTSWTAPNLRYEGALARFVAGVLSDRPGFLADFAAMALPLVRRGARLALARRVVQLTAPGVPDVYQGDELGLLALVDPDNRRPPDFARARRNLAALERRLRRPVPARIAALARLARQPQDERLMLWVTHAALALRRRAPWLFARGAYLPLRVVGSGASGWLAYLRHDRARLTLVAACLRAEPWREPASLRVRIPRTLAGATLCCALSGRRQRLASREVPLDALTRGLPLALWTGRPKSRAGARYASAQARIR